ncbi:WD repeat, SAM and U-box domain-containing protein 1-like isoform X1 [Haemaphysalis longicornis]
MAKRKWEVQQTLEAHAGDVTACAFSNDTLATCSNDKTVRLWLYAAGTFTESAVSPLLGHKYGVNAVQFSPLGTALASCSTDGSLLLWNVESGEQLGQLQHRSQAALRCCSFSPSGALLATGGDDETLVLWDVATRSPVRSLGGVHAAVVASCSFSPDGALLASVSSAGDLRIWDARYNHAGCLVTRTDAHDLGATGVHFSPQFEATLVHDSLESSYLLASCGNDDLLRVWQVRMAQRLTLWPQWVLEGHNGSVMCCRFSPGGQLLASSGADKTSMVWDVGTGKALQTLCKHSRYVSCCAFSSDGHMLATGSWDHTLAVWAQVDCAPGEEVPGQPLKPTFKMGVGEGVAAIGRWTAGQVGDWLDGLGLGEHREVFEANAIDGQELLHLTHEGLSAVLHVDAMGTRARLLREVQGLKHPLWRHLPGPGETSLPNELLCPITQQTMSDPVVAADGYSYERNAIQQWLANGKETSPMTGKPLEHKSLVANRTLQLLIQKYLR